MSNSTVRTVKEAVVEFSAAMLKSLSGKPWGVGTEFECPLCGGSAKAYSSPIDGRRIAKCRCCCIRVRERAI